MPISFGDIWFPIMLVVICPVRLILDAWVYYLPFEP